MNIETRRVLHKDTGEEIEGYLVTDTGVVIGRKGQPLASNSRLKNSYYSLRHQSLGKDTRQTVAQTVCATFNGTRPTTKHSVDHIDGNTFNNTPDNLRWATQSEQIKNKEIFKSSKPRGVRNVDTGETFKSLHAAARSIGLSAAAVQQARDNGHRSGGYRWESYDSQEQLELSL